jgi:hypothetical protein
LSEDFVQEQAIPSTRKSGLFQENLGDEVVLYDHEAHRVHRLNRSMALVWEAVDGQRSVAEIARLLSQNTGCECDQDMVLVALRQLEREGLLTAPAVPAELLPSRRELGRKFATAGISISALPVLASMMAPTPAMARSVDTSYSSFNQHLRTAQADIAMNAQAYAGNATAQKEYKAALKQGAKGTVAYMKGDYASANKHFEKGNSDLDSLLQALGF